MGRGDSSSNLGKMSILARRKTVSKQQAQCNQLVQEAQTGQYENVLTLLAAVKQQGNDAFWTEKRVEVLRQEVIYDLTARTMLAHKSDLRELLRGIHVEGLSAPLAKAWTRQFSIALAKHIAAGVITDQESAEAVASLEFVSSLSDTLGKEMFSQGENNLREILDEEYHEIAMQPGLEKGISNKLTVDGWKEIISKLLFNAESKAQTADDIIKDIVHQAVSA